MPLHSVLNFMEEGTYFECMQRDKFSVFTVVFLPSSSPISSRNSCIASQNLKSKTPLLWTTHTSQEGLGGVELEVHFRGPALIETLGAMQAIKGENLSYLRIFKFCELQ